MTSAAEKIASAYPEQYGAPDPRGENVVRFAPFVDPQEAARVLSEGDPSDELHAFLRHSLARVDARFRTEPPQPAPVQAPRETLYGFRQTPDRGVGELPPQHPAYEHQRPSHFDLPVQQREPLFEPDPYRHAPHPAPPAQGYPTMPAPLRAAPVDAGAPSVDGTPFEIPAFLRARPGVPPDQAAQAPAPAPAAAPAPQVPPSAAVQAPSPERATIRRPDHAALRSVAGELAWLYSVFPAIIALQIAGSAVWAPIASIAAFLAFLAYGAAWALWRPSLFQLRVCAGWQIVATAAVFRGLDTGSPEQWMHVFAAFAATAVVLVAMGGVEVFQRVRAR